VHACEQQPAPGGERGICSDHPSYKREKRNEDVTESVKVPGRGHALTIDNGWREVAQIALDFVNRFE
jgi:hypothetical protein